MAPTCTHKQQNIKKKQKKQNLGSPCRKVGDGAHLHLEATKQKGKKKEGKLGLPLY
jgi:hypothetical protein